jgi:hypothetical protein
MSIQPLPIYYFNTPPSDACGICLDPLNNGQPVVTHPYPQKVTNPHDKGKNDKEETEPHLFHKNCLGQAIRVQSVCPYCRKDINFKTVSSWKERFQDECDTRFIAIPIAGIAISGGLTNYFSAGNIMLLGIVALIVNSLGIASLRSYDGGHYDRVQIERQTNGLFLGVIATCLIVCIQEMLNFCPIF